MRHVSFLNGGGLDKLLRVIGVDGPDMSSRVGNDQFVRVTVTIEDQAYRCQLPYHGREREPVASWPYWDGKR